MKGLVAGLLLPLAVVLAGAVGAQPAAASTLTGQRSSSQPPSCTTAVIVVTAVVADVQPENRVKAISLAAGTRINDFASVSPDRIRESGDAATAIVVGATLVNLSDPTGHRVTYGCEDNPGGCNAQNGDACNASCQARGEAAANASMQQWIRQQLQAKAQQAQDLSCFFCVLGSEAWSGISTPFAQGIQLDQEAFSASGQVDAALKAGDVQGAQAIQGQLMKDLAGYQANTSLGGMALNFVVGVGTSIKNLPGDVASGNFDAAEHEVARLTLAAGTVAGLKGVFTAPEAGAGVGAQALRPSTVRFSQTSVNGVSPITQNMLANGWQGAPIDVVQTPTGLTSLDNTRLLAASQAGIDVQAYVHAWDEPLSDYATIDRFSTPRGVPQTWGDALQLRIRNQNSIYRSWYPYGSPFTGWGGG